MSDTELREIHDIFTDTWRFMKQFNDAQTDAEWVVLSEAADLVLKKHSQHPLCRTLLITCMKYIAKEIT